MLKQSAETQKDTAGLGVADILDDLLGGEVEQCIADNGLAVAGQIIDCIGEPTHGALKGGEVICICDISHSKPACLVVESPANARIAQRV